MSFRSRACRARRISTSPAKSARRPISRPFTPPRFPMWRPRAAQGDRHRQAFDIVGMTRAHMADPHIVRKIIDGREDDIRPCVGSCNYGFLIGSTRAARPYCIHNPATGRELEMPHDIAKAATRRKIVVVGAGPAGLEAARVAAERGHEVVVFETAKPRRRPDPADGAQPPSPRDDEHCRLARRAMRSARGRLPLPQRLGRGGRTCSIEKPDVVVIATGGFPHTECSRKSGNDLVVSSWDIISGDAGRRLPTSSSSTTPATTRRCRPPNSSWPRQRSSEIMTPDRSFAPETMAMNLVPYMRSLQKLDVVFTVTFRLESVRREGNELDRRGRQRLWRRAQGVRFDQICRQPRHDPDGRPLFREIEAASARNLGAVNYDDLMPPAGRRTSAGNPAGAFQFVPHRRRRLGSQYPCGDLRRSEVGQGPLSAARGTLVRLRGSRGRRSTVQAQRWRICPRDRRCRAWC